MILCLFATLAAAQTLNSREQVGLRGAVKSVSYELEIRTDEKPSGRKPSLTWEYDEKGNKTSESRHNADGSLSKNTSWGHEYDERGREVKTFLYDANGRLTNTGVSVYDDKDRRIERTQINPNGIINHYQSMVYDERSNNIRESYRNPDGSARGLFLREYDAKGRVVEQSVFNPDGQLDYKLAFTHDERGTRTMSLLTRQGIQSVVFRKQVTYDKGGNIADSVEYLNNDSIIRKESYRYDEFDAHQNLTKRITLRETIKDGKSSGETEITYRAFTDFSK